MARPFFAYMLRCADGSFYTGHTDDIDERMNQHALGVIGYTKNRKPLELVWSQEFESRYEALTAERQVKGWSRAKKQALIEGNWQMISLLAHIHGSVRRAAE